MSQAAQVLDVDRSTLSNWIKDCPELRLRWRRGASENGEEVNTEEPKDSITTHRGGPGCPDADRVQALQKENDLLAAGKLQKLGFDAERVAFLMNLQDMHRENFKTVLDIVAGGLGKQAIDILKQVEDISKALERNEDPQEPYHILPEWREEMLRNDRVNLVKLYNDLYKSHIGSVMAQAQLLKMKHDRDSSGGRGRNKRKREENGAPTNFLDLSK